MRPGKTLWYLGLSLLGLSGVFLWGIVSARATPDYGGVFGLWQDQEGDKWVIRLQTQGNITNDIGFPRRYYSEQIERRQEEIKSLKMSRRYVWENPGTGERVVQERFEKLPSPFRYKGLQSRDDEKRIKILEKEIAEWKKEMEKRPPDLPLLPKPTKDDGVQTVYAIQLWKFRKDGSIQEWPEARLISGSYIMARGVFDDIRDMKPPLPETVKKQLAASWKPPRWITLNLKQDPATHQVRLEGEHWAHHVTYDGETYQVKRYHTPYTKPLILTRLQADLPKQKDRHADLDLETWTRISAKIFQDIFKKKWEREMQEPPALEAAKPPAAKPEAAKPGTTAPGGAKPEPVEKSQAKRDQPPTAPTKDDQAAQEIIKRYEKLRRQINADYDKQADDWRRQGPRNEELQKAGAKDIERDREASLWKLDKEMKRELERFQTPKPEKAQGEAAKPAGPPPKTAKPEEPKPERTKTELAEPKAPRADKSAPPPEKKEGVKAEPLPKELQDDPEARKIVDDINKWREFVNDNYRRGYAETTDPYWLDVLKRTHQEQLAKLAKAQKEALEKLKARREREAKPGVAEAEAAQEIRARYKKRRGILEENYRAEEARLKDKPAELERLKAAHKEQLEHLDREMDRELNKLKTAGHKEGKVQQKNK